jgi:hypothetical protein
VNYCVEHVEHVAMQYGRCICGAAVQCPARRAGRRAQLTVRHFTMAVRLQDLDVGRSTGTAHAIDDVEPAQPMRLEEASRLQSAPRWFSLSRLIA